MEEKTEELLAKIRDFHILAKELDTYAQLDKLGIKKEEIVGRRMIKLPRTGLLCNENCQIKLKDGTEHIVPIELIYN